MIRSADVWFLHLIPLPDLQHTLSYDEFLTLWNDALQRIEHPFFHHHELILISQSFQKNTLLRHLMMMYPPFDFWKLYEDSVIATLSSHDHFLKKYILDLIHEEHKIALNYLKDLSDPNDFSEQLLVENFLSYIEILKTHTDFEIDNSRLSLFINYLLSIDQEVFSVNLFFNCLKFAKNSNDIQLEKIIALALARVMLRFEDLSNLQNQHQEALGLLTYWNLLNTITSYFLRYESHLDPVGYPIGSLSTASKASLRLIKSLLEPNGHPTDLSYALYLQSLSSNHEYRQEDLTFLTYTVSNDPHLLKLAEQKFITESLLVDHLYNLFQIPIRKLNETPSEPLIHFVKKRFYELIQSPSQLTLTQIEFFNKLIRQDDESTSSKKELISLVPRHFFSIPLPLNTFSEKSIIKSAAKASGLLYSALRMVWLHQKDFNLIEFCSAKKELKQAPIINNHECSQILDTLKNDLIILGSRFRQEHPCLYYEDLALNQTLSLQHLELYRKYKMIFFNDETMCEIASYLKLEHQRKELVITLCTLGFDQSLKKILTTQPIVQLEESHFERLFIMSISYNHPKIIKFLLELDRHPPHLLKNKPSKKEKSLEKISHGLYQSILLGHYSCIKVFINYLETFSTEEIASLFKLCVRYGHLEMIDPLMQRVNIKDLSLYDSGLLHEAVKKHSIKALTYLLERGCSLLKKNKQQQSIAHLALIFQQNDTLKFILDKAKETNQFHELVELTDSRGENLETMALNLEYYEWAEYLMKATNQIPWFRFFSCDREVRSLIWNQCPTLCCFKSTKSENEDNYPSQIIKKSTNH